MEHSAPYDLDLDPLIIEHPSEVVLFHKPIILI